METSASNDANGSKDPNIPETKTKSTEDIPSEVMAEEPNLIPDSVTSPDEITVENTDTSDNLKIDNELPSGSNSNETEANAVQLQQEDQKSLEIVTQQIERMELMECVVGKVSQVDGGGGISQVLDEAVEAVEETVAEAKSERPGSLGLEGASAPAGPSGTSVVSSQGSSPHQSVYHIKWIKWKDGKAPVITQNENGPCPLIALMNVLILGGKIQLPPMMEMITADQLMEYLGDCMLEYAPKNVTEIEQLNYEQNMHDAMAIFPKLQTGLDVNVQFTGVRDFEYTPECIIFDLLGILLYHGWLVDPQTPDVAVVGKLGYNQLVEKIITNKSSTDSEVVTEALIAEAFLEKTASQLTYHGLCELNATVNAGELAILFRNNHFSTIYKHQSELFQLVTDQGFLTESNVVWETLSNIDGDGQFVDFNFVTVPPKTAPAYVPSCIASAEQQIDQDYLVALSLQEEQKAEDEHRKKWEEYKQKQLGVSPSTADEELARRLQAEEEKRAGEAAQEAAGPGTSHQQPPSNSPNVRQSQRKKSDCLIL